MELTSLGHKSELIFTGFDGQVEDRGEYLVVRTLTNPNYFWGNLLIFGRAPRAGDLEAWRAIFKTEFPDPRIYHQTFAWQSSEGAGDISTFLEFGFELQPQAVMATQKLSRPAKFNADIEMRVLAGDAEWNEMAELQVASADGKIPRDVLADFYYAQNKRFRAMERAGRGHWYGAFMRGDAGAAGSSMVAALGLYHQGGLGRYQSVVTHPSYRRRGICGTLVYLAGQAALHGMKPDAKGEKHLVMCADPGYHALQIYKSVGFTTQQTEYGVSWWDRDFRKKREPFT